MNIDDLDCGVGMPPGAVVVTDLMPEQIRTLQDVGDARAAELLAEAYRAINRLEATARAGLEDTRLLDGLERHELSVRCDHGWTADNDDVYAGFGISAREVLRQAIRDADERSAARSGYATPNDEVKRG